jgi:hypothetical protein
MFYCKLTYEEVFVSRFLSCLICGCAILLAGCTTAMYTRPATVNKNPNRYRFTIETGGFSGASVADQRAVQEIKKFMAEKGYKSYKIIHRTDEFIPSGFKYIVQFYR